MPAVSVQQLTQRFGRYTAVEALSFNIAQGSIFGLIGPQGAGKTTILRSIGTLLIPSSGDVVVLGHSVKTEAGAIRPLLGFMPAQFGGYDELLVWEYLDFFARLYGLSPRSRFATIRNTLELLELTDFHDRYVRQLSRAMAQRLSLARCLLHDPELLVLDEPTAVLRADARKVIHLLLGELQAVGKTIVLSSAILSDIVDVCTHGAIIDRGKLVLSGSINSIVQQTLGERRLVIDLLGRLEPSLMQRKIAAFPAISSPRIQVTGLRTTIHCGTRATDSELVILLRQLIAIGLPVLSYREEPHHLEALFRQITRPEEH
ncbi:MAG: ABC transporter ATP-binding protein [Chloroflexi bacterium]|nr:ABC transporter ATP-binding protein [Chloroflexota bacterium]